MSTQKPGQSSGILVAMALCMALQMTGFAMFLPLFALRFDSFGAGVKALSTSDMAYAFAFAFAAPLIGMLADRFGRRPIILISAAGYVVVFSGYLFAAAAWPLILLRGLAGIFAAGLLPCMTSIVGDLAHENRRAQWVGIVTGGAAVGYIVGPPLGGLLYDRLGYVVPSAVSIAMAAGALLLAVFRIPETHTPAARPGPMLAAWRHGWRALPARPAFLLLMLATFGVMFAYAFVLPQFMFYAYNGLGWTSAQLGLIMSAYGMAFMLGAFAIGQLSDRVGRKPVLVLGLALFSAQFVGLLIFRDMIWIAVGFVAAGLGNALYDPTLSATILDITPPEYTAGMLGIKGMAGSLGNLLGPGLVLLMTAPSAQVGFLIGTALVIVLTLVCAFGLRVPQAGKVHAHVSNAAVTQ